MDHIFTSIVKPNTHRRRRRDETVLSRRRCVHEFATTADGFERTTQPSAASLQFCSQWVTTANGCVHTDDTTKLSPTSCEFVYTPPTRRDSTVSSRRRRRCVLGLTRRNSTRCWQICSDSSRLSPTIGPSCEFRTHR